jgi:hypothetical protein
MDFLRKDVHLADAATRRRRGYGTQAGCAPNASGQVEGRADKSPRDAKLISLRGLEEGAYLAAFYIGIVLAVAILLS